MRINETGTPLVLLSDSDDWTDDEFFGEWNEMILTWMPDSTQLAQLCTGMIETFTFRPLCFNRDFSQERFLLEVRRRNLFGLEHGRRQGWWPGWTNDGPWKPTVALLGDWTGRTMAHVMAATGFFASVGDARRNGWNKPVEAGLFRVGQRWLEIVTERAS
jgi:hypothetical protein